jgi:hypothetical protein
MASVYNLSNNVPKPLPALHTQLHPSSFMINLPVVRLKVKFQFYLGNIDWGGHFLRNHSLVLQFIWGSFFHQGPMCTHCMDRTLHGTASVQDETAHSTVMYLFADSLSSIQNTANSCSLVQAYCPKQRLHEATSESRSSTCERYRLRFESALSNPHV